MVYLGASGPRCVVIANSSENCAYNVAQNANRKPSCIDRDLKAMLLLNVGCP
jgi:hypothetical protein